MRFTRVHLLAAVSAGAVLALSACGSSGGGSTGTTTPTPSGSSGTAAAVCATVDKAGTDELAKVCSSGTITVSTDPAYPPQSSLNEKTGEYEGFDIDVATEIAKRLGVKTAWETPAWEVITAGGWNGRWDMPSAR